MRKILLSAALSLGLLTSLGAYELNGNLGVTWTGYKTAKKVGVSGTFKDVQISAAKNDNFVEFLKGAKATIKTATFDSKNPARDKSIVGSLFQLATSATIEGTIQSVNEEEKTLVLDFTMNEVTKQIPMSYEVKDNQVVASGKIDVLDFSMATPYKAFAKVCEALHEGVSYSEVGIAFTLPFK